MNLTNWLYLIDAILILILVIKVQVIIPFLYFHWQTTLNTIFFFWFITVFAFPLVWPYKPGDFFTENFESGLHPLKWEYGAGWKVEHDESGKPVLDIMDADRGGLAIPCLSWTDYEVRFETRIFEEWSGWIIRATSLNDYVHVKFGEKNVSVLYRISGIWLKLGQVEHGFRIETRVWYPVRILARGDWLSVYVTVDGREELAFQDKVLGTKAPVTIDLTSDKIEIPASKSRQLLTPSFRNGSFGFRLHDIEHAQIRNVKAYRLRERIR